MTRGGFKNISKVLPAVVAVAMLALLAGIGRLEIRKDGVAEYMARSRAAIEALPTKMGPWTAKAQTLDARAADLLKPNAERQLLYRNDRDGAEAIYMVIQVDDASFMTGHAPMNCYPGINYQTLKQVDRVWHMGGMDINGTEYLFRRENAAGGAVEVRNVRSFFVFPDGHTASSLAEIDAAAANYQKVKYGVTQVQLITVGDDPKSGFRSGLSDQRRDEIFQDLVGSEKSLDMIRTLRTGIPK